MNQGTASRRRSRNRLAADSDMREIGAGPARLVRLLVGLAGRRFCSGPGFLTLGCLLLSLGIAFYSVQKAQWVSPGPPLVLIMLAGVASTLVLRWRRFRPATSAGLYAGLVLSVVVWQGCTVLLASVAEGWLTALRALPGAIAGNEPATMHFTLFIVAFAWLAGSLSVRGLARRGNASVGIVLGLVTILANLRMHTDRYYDLFFWYLVVVLVLLGVQHLERAWTSVHRPGPDDAGLEARWTPLVLPAVVAFVIVGAAWLLPQPVVPAARGMVTHRVLQPLEDSSINLLATVPSKQTTVRSVSRDTLRFSSRVDLGEDVRYVVYSTRRPDFWSTRRYDTYHGWGWTARPASSRHLEEGQQAPHMDGGETLSYTVVNKAKTDVILTAGEFVSANIPVSLHSTSAAHQTDHILSVTAARLLSYGEKYAAASSPHAASPAQLKQAGDEYPAAIVTRYLQLPANMSWRVRELSGSVTSDSDTAYEKVRAVLDYLTRFTYTEQCTASEGETDGVHHFLFVERQGNCTNFASAAVIMLRMAGVPSRLVVGYISPDWDVGQGKATIRVKDAHARPEVYFPGHGWIEFEATPGFAAGSGDAEVDFPAEDAGAAILPESREDRSPDDAADSTDEASTDEASTDEESDEAAQTDSSEAPQESGAAATVDGGTDGSAGQVQGGIGWVYWVLLSVVLCLAVVLVGLRLVFGGWPGCLIWGSRMDRAYTRMCLLGSLRGVRPRQTQTPLEYSAALAHALPDRADDIRAIADAYSRSRFSREKRATATGGHALCRSWVKVSCAILNRLLRLARIAAGVTGR